MGLRNAFVAEHDSDRERLTGSIPIFHMIEHGDRAFTFTVVALAPAVAA